MTREELLAKLAERRASRYQLTWPQFTSAVAGLSAGQKATILAAVNSRDSRKVGEILLSVSREAKATLARAEVDAIAADNNITVDELITLMG